MLGKANVPAVGIVVGGTGLTATRVRKSVRPHAGGRTADIHVLEHVDHQVGRSRAQHFMFDLRILFNDFAVAVHNGFNHVRFNTVTAVREHRIGRRHFHKRCTHGTQRQARHGHERGTHNAELAGVVHHVVQAVFHTCQNSRQVLGLVKGAAERHHAFEVMFEVRRAPDLVLVLVVRVGNAHRLVVHRVAGACAVVHGRRIHNRLERRAGLTQRLHRTVPAGLVKVGTTHHGTDCTRFVFNQDSRNFRMVVKNRVRETALVSRALQVIGQVFLFKESVNAIEVSNHAIFGHTVLFSQVQAASSAILDAAANLFNLHTGNAIGVGLNVRVNRRVNRDAIGIQRVFAVLLFHVLTNFFVEIQARFVRSFLFGKRNRRLDIFVVFVVVNVAGIAHGIKHRIAAFKCGFRVTVRAVSFRALQHTGQNGKFRNRKAIERTAEVELTCRLETVVTASQVHFVHVEFKDFFFSISLFDADSRHHFLNLTRNRTFRREEQKLGQLLRQGRCTAELFARQGAFHNSRGNRPHVHAPVAIEGAVFGGHHGVNRIFGNRVEARPFATFHKVFVGNLSVHVINVRDKSRIDLLKLRKRRQFRREMIVDGDYSNKSREHRHSEND